MPTIDRPATTAGMSIRDAVMAMQSPRTTCRVCSFLRHQTPAEQAEWREMLAESVEVIWNKSIAVPMTERAAAMTPSLPPLSSDAVGKHRREHHDDLPA
jgi:hypothetical protein